jgi:hypothetical protein
MSVAHCSLVGSTWLRRLAPRAAENTIRALADGLRLEASVSLVRAPQPVVRLRRQPLCDRGLARAASQFLLLQSSECSLPRLDDIRTA